MNKQNSTERTAEVSQIASLIRAKAQKHPEVIDIVVAWRGLLLCNKIAYSCNIY
jgi:hypothetical protein